METKVEELEDSRVRVEVDVPPSDVERMVNRAARLIARDMRMPGFRKGKAPPSLVVQRVGYPVVLEEAVRDSMGEWYEKALLTSGVSAIGDPEIQVGDLPETADAPVHFHFEVAVRPKAKLGEYKALEVAKPPSDVPDSIVEREIDTLREKGGKLEPVERAGAMGDFVLIDFKGSIDGEPFEGGEASDYLLELGSDSLIEGFEEQLVGASADDERTVKVNFPDEYRAEHLAGKEAVFETTVKEVREKQLPEADDDFAMEVSEFDTVEELRSDIREKIGDAVTDRIEADFRMAVVDAVAENATIELPDEIILARANEMFANFERRLASQGMNPEMFLQMQSKTRDDAVEEVREDAERDLRREAVLSAVAEAEGIEVTDEELVEALAHTAEHERTTPEKLLDRLKESGRDSLVRDDVKVRKSIDLVAEAAKETPMSEAEAKEKLWDPEAERAAQQGGSLWSPGPAAVHTHDHDHDHDHDH